MYLTRMALTARDIRAAFAELARKLANDGYDAEILIGGGAALVLLFDARESTKDVDAVFLTPEGAIVRHAARAVADSLNLPADWLNDGAKGYFVGLSQGELLFEEKGLRVRSASAEQLLAMKLAAWRDAIDRADAMLLLSKLHGDKDVIWTAIERFIPHGDLNKATYAFDDLWEASHGD